LIFRLTLALNMHGLKMPVLANTVFGQYFFFSQHFEKRHCSLLRFLYDTQFLTISYFKLLFLYSRTMLSDKQSEHSFSPTTV